MLQAEARQRIEELRRHGRDDVVEDDLDDDDDDDDDVEIEYVH